MGKITALIIAVIGLIFMILVALIGFGAIDPQPMIDFSHAIAEAFRSLGKFTTEAAEAG